MNWNQSPYQHDIDQAEDLAYPPNRSPTRFVLLGMILPAIITYLSIKAWIHEEAIWFGRGHNDLVVHGHAAKSLAITYLSFGLFFHFRWCWGMMAKFRVYEIGTILSLIGFIGGLAYTACTLLCY